MAMGLASSYVENLGEADYDSLVDMGHHVLGCLKAMLDNGSAPSR